MKRHVALRAKLPPRRPVKTIEYTPRPRVAPVAVAGPARACVPVPKERAYRSEAYLRRVAALPCAHCGRPGPSQAAHSDQGKGMGIKAGDDTVFPLCADGPARRGCHTLVGATGLYSQEQRRALEQRYAEQTRILMGVE